MPLDHDPSRVTPERRALIERIMAEGDRRRRSRLVGAGATLVLVLGLVAATLTTVGDNRSDRQTLAATGGAPSTVPVPPAGSPADDQTTTTDPAVVPADPTPTTTPTGSAPSTTVPAPEDLPGTWSALPPSGVVARFGGARAWTGRELLQWGGSTEYSDVICESCAPPPVADGVAFDPATNRWRRLAPAPVKVASSGAWTGSELVVWGGTGDSVPAAYDPVRDSWRTFPPSPLPADTFSTMVALGGEVYVIQTYSLPHPGPMAAALDVASGTWRVLPDPPVNNGYLASTVVGNELVLAMGLGDQGGLQLVGLQPSGQWRVIKRLPDVQVGGPVFAGGRAWAVSCRYDEGTASGSTVTAVDLSTGAVTEQPGPAATCPDLVAAGGDVLALSYFPTIWQPESIRVHRLSGDRWQELQPPPVSRIGGPIWTGGELLFWGGCECSGLAGRAIDGGYRLRL